MKKYAKLKCSVCKRTLDQLVNLTHFVPNRCNITLGCDGLLKIEGYTNNGNTIRSTPEIGVTNWLPRGSTLSSAVVETQNQLVKLSTGTLQQVILAVKNVDAIADVQSTVNLLLIVEDATPKEYRKYTFRKTVSTKIINGIEDGPEKKTLRYDSTDLVEVFVNGVKIDNGTNSGQYQLYSNTTSIVPPNSIYFNDTLPGSNAQIDVIVSKASVVTSITLPFRRMISDNSRVNLGAWEGTDYVTVINGSVQKWYLYYCDISEQANLPLNSELRISSDLLPVLQDGTSKILQLSECAFLLSVDGVFTHLDQIKSKWIPLNELNSVTKYLTIALEDSVKHLFATELSTKNIFPILVASNFYSKSAITTNLAGNSEASTLDNSIIIGPDL